MAARYVAQGSILGPLLFILFLNDFSRSSTLLLSILFADDTSVFLEGTEYSKLIKSLNNEPENVTKWLNANRLTVNMKNTLYMIFHRAKFKTTGQDVVMQNSALTCVTTKFLGVIIDYKFKWNDHITYVKNKISKSIGILYKIRRFLDMNHVPFTCFSIPHLLHRDMGQCISHTSRATYKNSKEKYSGNNSFRILSTFRTTFRKN